MFNRVKLKFFIISCLLTVLESGASAQFYPGGDEDGRLQWKEITTAHYRVIYPSCGDSLALEYAKALEKYHSAVGNSAGYTPTENLKKKMPVILHMQTSVSNGLVSWAPKRIELNTVPETGHSISVPWIDYLTIHESRHASQMQFGHEGLFRVGRYLLGDMMTGAGASLYPGPSFMEGDAVLAETALTGSGRGRSAEFLSYYHAAFDNGDMRNWWRWRYGSQKYWTPDFYRAGYIRIAGIRALYDDPMFINRYYGRIKEHVLPFFNFNKTLREKDEGKMTEVFEAISDSLRNEWKELDARRGPSMDMRRISREFRLYTSYRALCRLDQSLYSIRSGLDRCPELVRIDSCGNEKRLHPFSSDVSSLSADPVNGRIVWTEIATDFRWKMKSSSIVRYMDRDGRIHTLRGGTRYFQVKCGNDVYAAIELPVGGGCSAVLLDPSNGDVRFRYRCPDGISLTDICFSGNDIYAIGISDEGNAVYNVTDGFRAVTEPVKSSMYELGPNGSEIMFICDADGVEELYSLDPGTGALSRRSSTPYGISAWACCTDSLVVIAEGAERKAIYKAPSDLDVPVDGLSRSFESFLAGKTAEQEKELGSLDTGNFDPEISAPARYSKFKHAIKFHSWAPVFVDYDAVMKQSFQTISSAAGLGATGFFQNELGNLYGSAAVRLDTKDRCMPYLNLNLHYSGIYPVFEVKADIGKKSSGLVKAYIPWSTRRNGLNMGIIPEVDWSLSSTPVYADSSFHFNNRISASLTGYIMENQAPSAMYPRLGVGLEIGYSQYPSLRNHYVGNTYAFLYGYLPGILRTHGIKLTALSEVHTGNGKYCTTYANTAPRGFEEIAVLQMGRYKWQNKFTIDYSLPFLPVDWTFLCPVAYIRNFEFTAHYDYAFFTSGKKARGDLYSVGADLSVRMENLLWIPYTTRIGVTTAYKGGSSFASISKLAKMERFYVGLIFTIDL